MIRLHGYWRSSAAYRVRIALALKGIAHDQVTHDLRTGAQRSSDYLAIDPQGLVPALETGDAVLVQSGAILEWLDEAYPEPPLLPAGATPRAIVRGMAAILGCDVHPLHNLRVAQALRSRFGADDEQVRLWIVHWIGTGLTALEPLVTRHGAGFAYGDAPGLVDCYLVPQLYAAARFGVDLAPFPRIAAAGAAAAALPAFAHAHPAVQPDADPA